MHLNRWTIVTTVAMLGCAATPGARPHDASRAQHEAMAAQEERAADVHAAHPATQLQVPPIWCSPNREVPGDVGFCWSSLTSTTGQHLQDAERHRLRAAEHRAASEALRAAEERACAGIAAQERDQSPFSHVDDIVGVLPLPLAIAPATAGTSVVFRHVQGLTAASLQRVLDCHLARNASLGHDVPEMSYCPLVPRGVHARAYEVPTGIAVALWSDDPAAARQIKERVDALIGARKS